MPSFTNFNTTHHLKTVPVGWEHPTFAYLPFWQRKIQGFSPEGVTCKSPLQPVPPSDMPWSCPLCEASDLARWGWNRNKSRRRKKCRSCGQIFYQELP